MLIAKADKQYQKMKFTSEDLEEFKMVLKKLRPFKNQVKFSQGNRTYS